MLILENRFKKVFSDPEYNCLHQVWKTASSEMSDVEFKEQALELLKLIEQEQPSCLIIDQTCFRYKYSEESNVWYLANLIPGLIKNNLEKVAVIISSDLLNQIKLEELLKTAKEKSGKYYVPSKFFDDKEKAFKWLKNR